MKKISYLYKVIIKQMYQKVRISLNPEKVMNKFKSLFQPSIGEVSWFDENYTVSIFLEGTTDTDSREYFKPAAKKGEEVLLEISLDDAEYLFEELRHILTERARLKYETYRQMDKAYWLGEGCMTDDEYQEREERLKGDK